MKISYALLTVISLMMFFLLSNKANAQEYTLELQQIEATSEAYLSPKLPSENLKEFNEKGYTLISNIKPEEFYFTIDKTSILFPDLSTLGKFTDRFTIKVQSGSISNYQVIIKLLNQISAVTGETIDPTVCDSGCNSLNSGKWESQKSYGLGFSIDNGLTYRPFPFENQIVLSPKSLKDFDIPIDIKIQTPQNLQEGIYQGALQMIVLPDI